MKMIVDPENNYFVKVSLSLQTFINTSNKMP